MDDKVKPVKTSNDLSWSFVFIIIILSSAIQLFFSYVYFNITKNKALFIGVFLGSCVLIIFFLILGLIKRFEKIFKLYKYVGVLGLFYSLGFCFLSAVVLGKGILLKIVVFSAILIASILCCVSLEFLSKRRLVKKQKNELGSDECIEYISPTNKKIEIISFFIIFFFICLSKLLGIFVFVKLLLPILGLCYSLFYSFLIEYRDKNTIRGHQSKDGSKPPEKSD